MSKADNEAEYQALIESCDELPLYLTIDGLGGLQWRINHDSQRDFGRGYLNQTQYDAAMETVGKLSARVKLAVAQTTRFGVTEPFQGENKAGSEQYWKWFRWWDAYAKALPDDEWERMSAALAAKEDASKWRPEGDWR